MPKPFSPKFRAVGRLLAILLLGFAVGLPGSAQGEAEGPVTVTLESYLVTTVTREDGTTVEAFVPADEARPGQIIEYRLQVAYQGDEPLPAETLLLTGPIPANTTFLDGSVRSEGPMVLTMYSADGGATFSEPPVIITITNEDGETEEVVAEPSRYTAVRWTVLEPLEPGTSFVLAYRVIVN